MVSDDTEHAAWTAEALIEATDVDDFRRRCARYFRRWIASAPAGCGWATLRAGVRLWLGWSPERSGVRSAGNGPCMRAPIIGSFLALSGRRGEIDSWVDASTRLTHTDPRAVAGARVVARAAAHASTEGRLTPRDVATLWNDPGVLAVVAADLKSAERWREVGTTLVAHLGAGEGGRAPDANARTRLFELADALGLPEGVTGYVLHTLPIAMAATVFFQDDFEGGIDAVVKLGGDTDTTAAIVGALLGTRTGTSGIPEDWRSGVRDLPLGSRYLTRLAQVLAERLTTPPRRRPPNGWRWLRLPRNAFFFGVVMVHALGRLRPA